MNKTQFTNLICNYERLYIYGAGEYGKTLVAYLLEIGLLNHVVSFLVTEEPTMSDLVFGKPLKKFISHLDEINVCGGVSHCGCIGRKTG